MDSISASATVMVPNPESTPAKRIPTAMPSGMLCSVTASAITSVPHLPVSLCILVMSRSRIIRNSMPIQKPATAGMNASLPNVSDCSIDGMSRLQTEAAVMMPAAKPFSVFCVLPLRECRIKNTQAAPRVVPKSGNKIPFST